MYLLDTVAVSESTKRRRNAGYAAWFVLQAPAALLISVVSLSEIARGATLVSGRDSAHARHLERWLAQVRATFADRLLPVDEQVAIMWGRLRAAQPTPPYVDSLIAATALAHGLTVVTRNVRDFTSTGVPVINPFD
jgi:predicted nucleic acid-binding protein